MCDNAFTMDCTDIFLQIYITKILARNSFETLQIFL